MYKNTPKPQRVRQSRSTQRKSSVNRQNSQNNKQSNFRKNSQKRSQSKSQTRRSSSRSSFRSNSQSSFRNRSSSRKPFGFYKSVKVPRFGKNQEGVHTISSIGFEIIIKARNGNPFKYTTIDYLFLALYFALYSHHDGRTLQNKPIKGKVTQTSIQDTINKSFTNIFRNFPMGIAMPTMELSKRFYHLFDIIIHWIKLHLFTDDFNTRRYNEIEPKSQWYESYKSPISNFRSEGNPTGSNTVRSSETVDLHG